MGPMDLSRFLSWISVVEEERPSMVTVRHSLPGTLWFCLVAGGRPRPIGTPPRPLPWADTTTYNQGGCEKDGHRVYIYITFNSIYFRQVRNLQAKEDIFLPIFRDLQQQRKRTCVCVRVLGEGERSGACFSLSASVSMVSVTAARQWQACREARGPSVASMCYSTSSLSMLRHLAHCPILLLWRQSGCHQQRGTTLQTSQLLFYYYICIRAAGVLGSEA